LNNYDNYGRVIEMFVDDHNEMYGGKPEALTARISPQELEKLKNGEILQAENKKRGITVMVMVEEYPKPTSAS
jgi:hypothetical protein